VIAQSSASGGHFDRPFQLIPRSSGVLLASESSFTAIARRFGGKNDQMNRKKPLMLSLYGNPAIVIICNDK
jgi:hypothetical protein